MKTLNGTDHQTNPIGISLNFDSLHEAYGFPTGYTDPSFHEGFDRLAELCGRHGFPLSIFVVGRDLLDSERAAAVKEWARQGHEIGNHSWSHHFNLATLSAEELRDDVCRTHDLIATITGSEPKGFIAPAWSTSRDLVRTLIELDYLYDTSAFPSVLLYPMVGKIALNHWRKPVKGLRMLRRKDWLGPFRFPNKPFYLDKEMKVRRNPGSGRLLILPLPAKSRFSPAIWHTLGFMLGWDKVRSGLKQLSEHREGLYYLIHPADFLGIDDMDPRFSLSLARMDVPIEKKMQLLGDIFSLIKASGRPVTTLREMANGLQTRHSSEEYS